MLGAAFLGGTAFEWHELIDRHQLTISRNLFGTTYYTLVGFHALHVTAGVIIMLIVLGLALGRQVTRRQPGRGRAGLLVLALRGRRLGGRVHGGLPGGTVSPGLQAGSGERRMASDAQIRPQPEAPAAPDSVEMPRPTAAPLVLALGITLLAAGVALGTGFLVVGAVVVVAGLSIWIVQLLPGRGHVHEPLVEPARPQPVTAVPGGVEHLRPGMPGYRLRLPQDVHPISAGLKGGIVGGAGDAGARPPLGTAERPRPLVSGQPPGRHGPAGGGEDDRPRVGAVSRLAAGGGDRHSRRDVGGLRPDLRRAAADAAGRPPADRLGRAAHAAPVDGGELRGDEVVNPVLPGSELAVVPALAVRLRHPMPAVVLGAKRLPRPLAGVAGGLVGGAAMALPAVLWAAASGRGFWYPVNLLAGMLLPGPGNLDGAELGRFHADWFLAACALHAVLSIGFGVLFALVLPRLPPHARPDCLGRPGPAPGVDRDRYGLMGVVNPVLQERVDWPWFIVSQFVFGVAAAVVVLRSEMVPVPPAGLGPDRAADFVAGEGGGRS